MADTDIPFPKCKFSVGSVFQIFRWFSLLQHHILGLVSTFKHDDLSAVYPISHLPDKFNKVFKSINEFGFILSFKTLKPYVIV